MHEGKIKPRRRAGGNSRAPGVGHGLNPVAPTPPAHPEIQIVDAPEVLRVASELYAKDRVDMERAAQREELLRAAAEAGLPPEYLDRAAAAIHVRRGERRRGRRWRLGMCAALGLVISIALVAVQLQAPPPYLGPPAAPLPPAAPAMSTPQLAPTADPHPIPIGRYTAVDLSRQATESLDASMLNTPGNDLADLGAGSRTLGGVRFTPSGVVTVGPGETQSNLTGGPVPVPREVVGIPIGMKARRLYFLQGTHFDTRLGARIGAYVFHYENGATETAPIRFGADVLNWWDGVGPSSQEALSHVVWRGRNDAAAAHGTGIRLFMKRWDNPHPGFSIESMDMLTGDQPRGHRSPAPFLVALTAEE
jgi:hypothetical protein